MNKQDELREKCRFLKWSKGISYQEIAEAIDMDKYSFYNFISGRRVNVSYKVQKKLDELIKEVS